MGRVELVTWNVTSVDEEYALFRIEGDLEAYRDRIDEVEGVRRYNLTPIDADTFYSYVVHEPREVDRQLRAAFARRSLVIIPPIVYVGARMTLTVVGDGEDLRALLADLPDRFDVSVEEVGDYDRRHRTIAADLTARQLEAVRTALEVGYYAVPREAGLEAVADRLGCAESTASTHLRKAEARVMRHLVDAVSPPPA